MKTAVIAFVLSMLCGTILTPIIRRLSYRFGALDHALSSRKIHGRPIPRLGGIAIVFAFYAPLVGLMLFQTAVGELFLKERDHVIGLFVGGLGIGLLGLYDDLRGAGAGRKFLVQFLVAGLLYYLGFRIEALANPLGDPIILGWTSAPFTLLWIVGVINALNLIDGLDGLAGGVALFAVITTFLISIQRGHPLMTLFSSALAGAIVGFLFYNFNPASIFMGDTGSMFLGFVLASTAIQTNQKSSTAFAILIPAITLGLPIVDTLLAIARRAIRGRPLFQADKEHIHHRLLAAGLSHRQTVLVLYGFCLILGAAALILTYAGSVQSALMLIALAVVSFVFLRTLGYMRLQDVSFVDRRRNRALRTAIRGLGQRLRVVRDVDEIWPIAVEAMTTLGASTVSIRARLGVEDTGSVLFEHGSAEEPDPRVLRSQFAITGGGKSAELGLELGWSDGRQQLDRDTEGAVDILCEYLNDAFEASRRESGRRGKRSGVEPQA
jgi:UDP-GlcNAc:undecaprenyl-phosphate/decaprenyl-phosphate GlcNAc-1-phosphate transferase